MSATEQVVTERAETNEQTRARYPDDGGLHRARRRARLLRGLRRRRADDPVLPDLDARPLARLEDADPVLRPPLPGRVFDPRGNGRSDRPTNRRGLRRVRVRAGRLDVMDASGIERAIVVALSRGAQRALLLAAEHPERVDGLVFIGPVVPGQPPLGGLRWRLMSHPRLRAAAHAQAASPPGAGRSSTPHYIRGDYRDFVEWFAGMCTNEPHSTKGFEDGVEWGLETDPDTLLLTIMADAAAPVTRRDQLALARRVRCPVLVINGTKDRVTPHRRRQGCWRTRPAGGCSTIEGGDHMPDGRQPVEVNLALREFVEPAFRRDPTVHRSRRAAAGAVRLLADRPRPRPARRRDRARAARSSSTASRSTGSPRTR